MSERVNDPTWDEVLNQVISARFEGVHTCLPATVQSYDHRRRKASVQPMIQKAYLSGKNESLPVLSDVPVVWPAGGGGVFTFPLRRGDGILLVFSERNLENYLESGRNSPPKDGRKFDLSDAIAIPGLYDFTKTSPVTDADAAVLTFGGATIKLKGGKLALGNAELELLDILSQTLNFIATGTTGAGPLSTAASAAALKLQLDQFLKGSL